MWEVRADPAAISISTSAPARIMRVPVPMKRW
jgi:hypothetical protein